MAINKEKQIYGTWYDTDITLHCYCGESLQINNVTIKRCPECNQLWYIGIQTVAIDDEANIIITEETW